MSEFLGPYGKATIILMRSHFDSDLPKLKDLKKLLHIPDGRYYKSGGRNYFEINKLEKLLMILQEIRGEEKDWNKTNSSDYLITVAEVHSNLFMALKYTAQVVDGFNLTDSAMKDLDRLIAEYNQVCSMRNDIKHVWDMLNRNCERAKEKGYVDNTILNPDVSSLQKILAGYGDSQYANAAKNILDWYEIQRWKVKSSSNSKSTHEDDESADAAVS
jgi:hypothetical protein